MKKKIADIVFRKDLYPREDCVFRTGSGKDFQLIEKYVQSIEFLPPIAINQDDILIDGWHRLFAHKKLELDEIEVVVINTESDREIKWKAAEMNCKHGKQLTNKEKARFALFNWGYFNCKELSELLSISISTVQNWTGDIRTEHKRERNEKIIDRYLHKKQTQETIAKELDISQTTVSETVNQFIEKKKFLLTNNFWDNYIKAYKDYRESTQAFFDWCWKNFNTLNESEKKLLIKEITSVLKECKKQLQEDVNTFAKWREEDDKRFMDKYPNRKIIHKKIKDVNKI